jgi:hypothetical protein
MTQQLSHSQVVHQLAEHVALRLTRRATRDLQRMTEHLGIGDDSGLTNVWEEICVQVQFQESVMWDVYVETANTLLAGDVENLLPHEREALWLQTPEGVDWDCEDEADRDAYPVLNDDVVEYLWRDYLLPEADRWSNRRIRAHLDRAMATDI